MFAHRPSPRRHSRRVAPAGEPQSTLLVVVQDPDTRRATRRESCAEVVSFMLLCCVRSVL